jgi:hypothetical protein
MTKRSSKKQNEHNSEVRKIAEKLKREGWSVEADLGGYDRPDPIGRYGHIPDIRARKARAERLIEVETKDTVERDKKQHEAFRKSVAQRKRTRFEIEIAD